MPDKKALILCSSDGLGFAIAKQLHSQGFSVTLTGRDSNKLSIAAGLISSFTETVLLDLDSESSRENLYSHLNNHSGYDVLINNTGGPASKPILDIQPDEWEFYFKSMVLPIFEITNIVAAKMKSNQWGRIINLTSSGVVQPIPNLGISNSLRSTIIAWAKTLSNELAPWGITVNTLIPGRIDTARVKYLDDKVSNSLGKSVEEVKQASIGRIPVGRYGQPEELAGLVGYLTSENASYITGALHRVDGGMIQSI